MYKNKVLGLLSWAWLCPSLGEEAKEASASLSGNRSLLAPLPDARCGRPLPSFWRHYGGDCGTNHAEAFTLLLQFSKLPREPTGCFFPIPKAPSTQHPVPSTQHCTVLAANPRLQVPFQPPNPQGTM